MSNTQMEESQFQVAQILTALKHVPRAYFALFLLMVISLASATWLTPHKTWFDHIGQPDYEKIIPEKFGNWIDNGDGSGGMIVSPEQAATVNSIYSQIVSRTYQYKPTGEVIMLSIGYGDVQLRAKQLHRPDACYSSQGFQLDNLHPEDIYVENTPIGLFRFSGVSGNRTEQVTYWIRIGNKIISGPSYELNLKRMSLGLKGYIADGLLFRVSSIGVDSKKAQRLQDQFISDLLMSVGESEQISLIATTLKR